MLTEFPQIGSPRARSTGPIPRRRIVPSLACFLWAVAGCQSMIPLPSLSKAGTATAAGADGSRNQARPARAQAPAPFDGAVARTDFRSEVSPSQQCNVHLELARGFEAQGHFDAAVAEYDKALEACARRGAGLAGPAVAKAQKALVHRRMAAAFDRLGRFAQAEAHYRSALKISPNDSKVWNDAGYSYYLQSRWKDAERSLKTAAKLDPDNPRIQTNLGLTLAAAGKTDAALAALTKAGGPAVGHANLGYLLAAAGKTDAARQHYQTALRLQPELSQARQALAQLDVLQSRTTALSAARAGPLPPLPSTDSRLSRASTTRAKPGKETQTPR
jgi:Flp pilus assembly protein TadD